MNISFDLSNKDDSLDVFLLIGSKYGDDGIKMVVKDDAPTEDKPAPKKKETKPKAEKPAPKKEAKPEPTPEPVVEAEPVAEEKTVKDIQDAASEFLKGVNAHNDRTVFTKARGDLLALLNDGFGVANTTELTQEMAPAAYVAVEDFITAWRA